MPIVQKKTSETNPYPVHVIRIVILALVLLSFQPASDGIPFDGSHHAPPQPGQAQVVTRLALLFGAHLSTCNITLGESSNFPTSGTCQKPPADAFGVPVSFWARATRIASGGSKPLVVVSGQVYAVAGAYYADTVELSHHVAAPAHEVDPGAIVTIHGAANLVLPTRYVFHSPAGASAYRGMGRVIVRGPLTSTAPINQIDIRGDVNHFPVTLITYTQISGTWRAGVIPPGTQIEITPKAIRLIRSNK